MQGPEGRPEEGSISAKFTMPASWRTDGEEHRFEVFEEGRFKIAVTKFFNGSMRVTFDGVFGRTFEFAPRMPESTRPDLLVLLRWNPNQILLDLDSQSLGRIVVP